MQPSRVVVPGAVLLVVGSAFALGGVHPEPLAAGAGIVCAMSFALVIGNRRVSSVSFPLLVWALLFAGAWSAAQSLPLGRLAELFAPAMAEHWAESGQAAVRATVDLAATRAMAVKCVAGALLLVVGIAHFGRSQRMGRVTQLLDLVVATAVAVVAVGIVQSYLGSERILFFYEPRMGPIRAGLRGPFVNPDHCGAYLAVASALSLGRSLVFEYRRFRLVHHVLSTILIAGLLLTLSVSAWAGLALALIVMGLAGRRRNRSTNHIWGMMAPLLLSGAALAGACAYFGVLSEPGRNLAVQLGEYRQVVRSWGRSLELLLAAPLTGIGAGSLTDLLPAQMSAPAVQTSYLRNSPLQMLLDFGFPLGTLLLVGLGLGLAKLRRQFQSDRSDVLLPVIGGLSVLMVVALLDFALEVPAVGIVGILLLAALMGQSPQAVPTRTSLFRRLPKPPLRLTLLGTTVALCVVSIWSLRTSRGAETEMASFYATWQVGISAGESDAIVAAAPDVLLYRPAAGRIYTLVGQALLNNTSQQLVDQVHPARRWLERAQRLLPTDARTQRLLGMLCLYEDAEGLAAPAVAHFRRAIELRPDRSELTLAAMSEATDDLGIWMQVAVELESYRALANHLLVSERAVDALRLGSAGLANEALRTVALETSARASMALGEDVLARNFAQSAIDLSADPDRPDAGDAVPAEGLFSHVVLAQLDLNAGKAHLAMARLLPLIERGVDAPVVLFTFADTLLELAENGQQPAAFEAMLGQTRELLRPQVLAEPDRATRYHLLSARFYRFEEEWRAVASASRNGLELNSDSARLHALLGEALLALDDVDGAVISLMRALALAPDDEQVLNAWSVAIESGRIDPPPQLAIPAGIGPTEVQENGSRPLTQDPVPDEEPNSSVGANGSGSATSNPAPQGQESN